jgi:hypothetical protein
MSLSIAAGRCSCTRLHLLGGKSGGEGQPYGVERVNSAH